MNKLYTLLLCLAAATCLHAQNNYLLKGCARYWANNHPIKGVEMSVGVDYATAPDVGFTGTFSPDSLCSEVTVQVNPALPNNGFSIGALPVNFPNDYRNGLSVVDLICIQRHILGLEPLPFYAQIAADANNSKSITTFDIVELRKVLQGIYDELPNTPSWFIWPPYCPVFNPANPFANFNCPNFPFDSLAAFENRDIPINVIKIGDVDGDYNFDGPYQPGGPLAEAQLFVAGQAVQAGDTLTLRIYRQAGFNPDGVQFALRYDTAALQLTSLLPGSTSDQWAIFPSGKITHVGMYFSNLPDTLGWLKFVVKTTGAWSDWFAADTLALTPLYAKGPCQSGRLNVQLAGTSGTDAAAELPGFQAPSPNPYAEWAVLRFELQAAAAVRLEVFDLHGRLTHRVLQNCAPGPQQFEIPAAALAPGQMGVYRLTVGEQMVSGKIIRQ